MTQLPEGVLLPKWYVLRASGEHIKDGDKFMYIHMAPYHIWQDVLYLELKRVIGTLAVARPMTTEEIEAATMEKCCTQVCFECAMGEKPTREATEFHFNWRHSADYRRQWCKAAAIRQAFHKEGQTDES